MVTQLTTTRQERGQTIANTNGQVQRIDELLYIVNHNQRNGEYTINKHKRRMDMQLPRQYIPTSNMQTHPRSQLFTINKSRSQNTKHTKNNLSNRKPHNLHLLWLNQPRKDGIRKNKAGNLQVFHCKDMPQRLYLQHRL